MSYDWQYAFGLLNNRDFWHATWMVVQLSLLSWVVGIVLGFGLALCKQSSSRLLRGLSGTYIWFFRSLPLLVLLIFIYNLPQVWPATSTVLSSPFWAGLIALVMSETAYIAEIHRGGLLSVPTGQREAGQALGIRYGGIQRLIVIPQAVRIALPALANQYVTIVKLTSLVSVISLAEILMVGQRLYTRNFLVLETMMAVAFYYVFIVTVFDRALGSLERHLDVRKRGERIGNLSRKEVDQRIGAVAASERAPVRSAGDALVATSIYKAFGDVEVLRDVGLRVGNGEVVSVIGPSGSGKTTLIRTLNGLETLDKGTVKLHGAPFIEARSQGRVWMDRSQLTTVGMVFQGFHLFAHLNVLDNLLMAPRYHDLDDRDTLVHSAWWTLDRVGMAEHGLKYPHQLSGGQQQRVAIARALMMRPEVLLFDEPTSALDPETVGEVLSVIESLAREGMTMVIVTHEMGFAFDVSNRILFMEAGKVVCDASPEELKSDDAPARVRQFLHNVAFR